VIDPFGGRRDLDARTIRALSAAVLAEDPLRMLRAARYVATLDGFEIDAPTRSWIAAGAAAIEAVAGERIQSEWALLLAGRSWATGVVTAYELGLGPRTLVAAGELQGVAAWEAHERGVDDAGGATEASGTSRFVGDRVTGRLAALLSDADLETLEDASLSRSEMAETSPGRALKSPGMAEGDRMAGSDRMAEGLQTILTGRRWPKAVARRAARIAAWAADLDGEPAADALVDRALADHTAAARAALLARARAEHRGGAAPKACETLELLARRAAEERWVSGAELRGWGIPEGPELGALLDELARGQLQRRWRTADGAREWARRRAESMAASWRAAGT
jgi:tRNA nucleotidyltransferase/poly(A) polymerase